MQFDEDDIAVVYKIKCGKYRKEDLTEELKEQLMQETINEIKTMEQINEIYDRS